MKRLSKEQHIEAAKAMHRTLIELRAFNAIARNGYPKTHPVWKSINALDKALGVLRCRIDTEWHRVINDDDFERYGNVYYGHGLKLLEDEIAQ